MSEAERDENFVPTLIGVDKADLEAPAKIAVNPDVDGSGLPGLVLEIAE